MDLVVFEGEGYKVDLLERIPNKFVKDKLIVIRGKNDDFNRKVLSSKHVDLLLDPHLGNRNDFMHHRNSGLNQVLCKLARDNNIAIGFSFSSVLRSKEKGKYIGRMMQNIRLCRKYKVRMVIGSFAESKNEIRGLNDIQAFFKVIGMTGKEVVMDYVEKRLAFKRRFIRKGVMLAE
ncbi:hypothetical protein HN681_04465 [archaeon]|jgi:RNase P/RNase MRP subunit p30|nr:hypothetical protein [archaeon]MBT3731213.1 hypothetical protein [archaeon]MBT4670033.1 hypothetical protein [archaeon]MBT5287765.1 hypothetical protein [archaeon]MBT7052770.1 hypothetical protein [archaeon]